MELRDGGEALGGFGVGLALAALSDTVAPALINRDSTDQLAIDSALEFIDGTPTFQQIGGNVAVATSLAVLAAHAAVQGEPVWRTVAMLAGTSPTLPLPEIQIFGGGAHASRRLSVQDFMVMVPGAATLDEALAVSAEIYHAAGAIMAERGTLRGVADEGGWWPNFASNEEAIETLLRAIERAGETPGERVVLSLDIAATQFRTAAGYRLDPDAEPLSADAMVERLAGWTQRFPIVAVEDPLAEDDDAGMAHFMSTIAGEVQVIGDDFLVTDPYRIKAAASAGGANAALIKVNQAGTVSRALAAFAAARRAGWSTIVSARSGETEDEAIAHLAVGLGAGQLKVGSMARGERTAKWNACLRIAETLGESGFVGGAPLAGTWWGEQKAMSR